MLDLLRYLSGQIISPDRLVKKRFASFKKLLDSDRRCHHFLAELETIHYSGKAVDINRLRTLYTELSTAVEATVNGLHALAPGQYRNLIDYYKKLDFYCRFALAPPKTECGQPYVLPINGEYEDDRFVGGKGLHLSHMVRILSLPVPPGFIISTSGWNLVVESNGLRESIDNLLAEVEIDSVQSLQEVSRNLVESIMQASLPGALLGEIETAVNELQHGRPLFAVRSSAVAEDSELSFAGQYLSLLNVEPQEIGRAYLQVAASRYAPEAMLYRILNGLDDAATPMAVIVLEMVQARNSGVVETVTSEDKLRAMMVHSVAGLGDTLMAGQQVPEVISCTFKGDSAIPSISKEAEETGLLSQKEIHQLICFCRKIHEHYRSDQEIEWSIGEDDSIFLLQSRPRATQREERLENSGQEEVTLPLLLDGGVTGASGSVSGKVYRLDTSKELRGIPEGSILVCDTTPPSLVSLLANLAGVIARYGSPADHFSSVAREFGIPVLLQLGDGIDGLENAEEIFLQADTQRIYSGSMAIPQGRQTYNQIHAESSVGKSRSILIDLISPLSLLDPSAENFMPEGCRSLHDIVRFAHEKGVEAMFLHNPDSFLRKPSTIEFVSDIPLQMYLVDAGGGVEDNRQNMGQANIAEVTSLPFRALWKGLSHSGVNWRERQHFDWESYDSVALAGGMSRKKDTSLLSYCLVSRQYLNVNMRFGYHFSLIDSFCGNSPEENYILIRFAGGGGTEIGKDLRLLFLDEVLGRIGFTCQKQGDLLDGRLSRLSCEQTLNRLEQLGRLLGSVRLLDMVLKEESELSEKVDLFFSGIYDFSSDT